MKRKLFIILLSFVAVLACAFALSACGEKHSHSYSEKKVKPTCTERGYTLHSCDCGDSYEDNFEDALGHDLYHRYEKQPTCTDNGWEEHDRCSRCDYSTEVEIPALGHDLVQHEAQAVTCAKGGWEDYETCSRWLCPYTTKEEIAPLGHKFNEAFCTVCKVKVPTEGLTYRLWDSGAAYTITGTENKDITELVLPDFYNGLPVKTIEREAFADCKKVTSLTISENITDLGYYSFGGPHTTVYYNGDLASWCELKGKNSVLWSTTTALYIKGERVTGDIVIPDSVRNIDSYSFYNCTSITSVEISDRGYYFLDDNVFRNCVSLKTVILGEGARSMSYDTFRYCSSLESLVIPLSITEIGNWSFDGCTSLTSVYYKGTAEDWKNVHVSYDNENLLAATFYYYSETKPSEAGNYWHFVDGKTVAWSAEA